ncbi:uncharacterized protein [Centruroides vittatus]|uniref:uncharacterized protein n=1 Tax=Centruroides vittatus TaxID=120091 RepID=UPI00350EBF77
MMRQQNMYGSPWYRGYMPRSYIAPHKLASFGCAVYLIAFGIITIFAGTIATVVSNHADRLSRQHDEDPRFQDPFFKKAREDRKKAGFGHDDITNVVRIVGTVFICIGVICILFSIGLCCFAKFHMDKRSKNQNNSSVTPLNEGYMQQGSTYPPPPPGSYPQQPQPPPGSYPQQPPSPPGSYPSQYTPVSGSYPPQPVIAGVYSQQAAPSYPYPPPTQHPPPSEPYVSEKTALAPYPESQGSLQANASPIGFKEG